MQGEAAPVPQLPTRLWEHLLGAVPGLPHQEQHHPLPEHAGHDVLGPRKNGELPHTISVHSFQRVLRILPKITVLKSTVIRFKRVFNSCSNLPIISFEECL